MRQKLIESISIQIDQIFKGISIYTEHIKQRFEKGSFFIRIIKDSEKAYISNRYKLFNNIEITYTPKHSCIEEINYIKENLFEKMKKLKFEEGYIIGENIQSEIKDNLLKFYIDYNFYVFRIEDSEKMNKLFLVEEINEK